MYVLKTGLMMLGLSLLIACGNTNSDRASSPVTPSPAPKTQLSASQVAQENFAKHCTSCHGERGEAGTVNVNNKNLRVPSLLKGHPMEHTDEELAKQIADGDDEMPAFKDKLTSEEINGLVTYVRKLQGK